MKTSRSGGSPIGSFPTTSGSMSSAAHGRTSTSVLKGVSSVVRRKDRALAALQDLRLKHRGETVLGSTHGGLLGCLLLALDRKLRFEDALSMPTPAVFSLKHRNDRWHLSSPPISLLPSNS
jgi:broad specificity phosphatase PhoE